MAGENKAVVLNAVMPLDDRQSQVADLRYDGKEQSGKRKKQVVGRKTRIDFMNDKAEQHHCKNAEHHTADAALNRLFGADFGNELMFPFSAEQNTAEIGENIGDPRADKDDQIDVFSALGKIM